MDQAVQRAYRRRFRSAGDAPPPLGFIGSWPRRSESPCEVGGGKYQGKRYPGSQQAGEHCVALLKNRRYQGQVERNDDSQESRCGLSWPCVGEPPVIEAGYQAEPDRRTNCVEKQRRLKGKQSSADSDESAAKRLAHQGVRNNRRRFVERPEIRHFTPTPLTHIQAATGPARANYRARLISIPSQHGDRRHHPPRQPASPSLAPPFLPRAVFFPQAPSAMQGTARRPC
jgi:hypothetical protein